MAKEPHRNSHAVWGSHIKVHTTAGSKLDMQAVEGRWMGFDPESNGHRVYLPDTRRVAVERSITFDMVEVMVPLEGSDEGATLPH